MRTTSKELKVAVLNIGTIGSPLKSLNQSNSIKHTYIPIKGVLFNNILLLSFTMIHLKYLNVLNGKISDKIILE